MGNEFDWLEILDLSEAMGNCPVFPFDGSSGELRDGDSDDSIRSKSGKMRMGPESPVCFRAPNRFELRHGEFCVS
jgi:hypothetical protein